MSGGMVSVLIGAYPGLFTLLAVVLGVGMAIQARMARSVVYRAFAGAIALGLFAVAVVIQVEFRA